MAIRDKGKVNYSKSPISSWNKGTTETVHLTTNEFVKKYYIMFKCSDCQISQYQDAGSIRMVTKNYWETNHEQADQLDHLPFKK